MKRPGQLSQNDALLQKLSRTVIENLENEQFGVEDLSEQVGISRSHLHRKLKLLKGLSVSQFIRQIRLEEAMKMLQNDVATTSEIAYRVGFGSPSYFHRCFNQHYGHPPGEIKKRLAEKREEEVTGRQTNKSLAVLPLENFTGDREQDYFVNGFHDALIGALGQISSLDVISRTSTLRYVKTIKPLQEIANELGVDLLVEGSVLGSGDHVRIQLQLIEAFPNERHLWAQDYAQDIRNIMVLQSEMVRSIAREIHVTLTPEEETLLKNTTTVNPNAYKAYLKGMFHWDKLTDKDLNIAINYFELALQLDPDYALAYAGISLVWVGRLQQGLSSYFEGGSKMKIAAIKAKSLELENTPPEVHYLLGASNCWVEWNYREAEKDFRRAIALNPNFSSARAYLSHILNILHQPEEAMEQIEIALELDPFNPLLQALYGMDLMFARQFDKAIKLLTKTLETAPTDPVALSTLRTAYHMKNMYPKALEIWKSSYAAKEDHEAIEALLRGDQVGGYKGALENLAKTLIDRSSDTYVTPWQIGTLYTRAGNIDEAIAWLEKAYHAHDSNMPYIGVDPIFDILRPDPRFQNLLKKMNLPPEAHPLATS